MMAAGLRHSTLPAVLAAISLAPGMARAADGPYVAVRGGLSGPGTVAMGSVDERHDTGSALALALGYQRGALRLEIEAAQHRASLNRDLPVQTALPVPGAPDRTAPSGASRVRAVMANLMVETGLGGASERIRLFAGAGVGPAWLRALDHRPVSGTIPWVNGGTTAFAWQARAGARLELSHRLSAELSLGHFSAGSAHFRTVAGERVNGGQGWNSVLAGLDLSL